jgi:uncharacterized lipoprotein YajG
MHSGHRKWAGKSTWVGNVMPLVAALILFLLGGCAFTQGQVNVAYQASTPASPVAESSSPPVLVQVSDKRTTQVVGQKINGFGMKTADIVSTSDVPGTLKNAFETELSNRGFKQGEGGNLILVTLDNFQNQFTLGFFSGEATATIGINVTVKGPGGVVAYNQYITGQSKESVQLAIASNAEEELNAAMRDAVGKVFADAAFIGSLKKA